MLGPLARSTDQPGHVIQFPVFNTAPSGRGGKVSRRAGTDNYGPAAPSAAEEQYVNHRLGQACHETTLAIARGP